MAGSLTLIREGPLTVEGKLTGKSPTSAGQAAANPGR
jgi:hypothetical protein